MRLVQWVQSTLVGAAIGLSSLQAAAEDIDIAAMLTAIDERAGQYGQLIAILQGADATRALAAFDVMLAAGDKTLRETAISAALAATDSRLRARALWETLVQKDSLTLVVATDALNDEVKTELDDWIGGVSTWPITARYPETQCLNLYGARECSGQYHLSVSGLQVDIIYTGRIQGQLSMNDEGLLVGEVTNPASKTVFPVSIQLR